MDRNGKTIPSPRLVGTVHRDPRGKAKLLGLLQQEQPSAISVEISPYARIFRAQRSAAFRATLRENLKRIHEEEKFSWREIFSHSAIRGIFFLLKEPYEWRAAEAYARQKGIVLVDIDLSRYSEERLSHLPELVSGENLRALLRLSSPDLTEEIKAHYNRARFLFSHPPSLWPQGPEERERETFMAEGIRRLVRQARGQKVLHIGGWEHLLEIPGGSSLYELLKDLRPTRALLSEAHKPGKAIYGGTGKREPGCFHKNCEKAVEKFSNRRHNLIELQQFMKTAYFLVNKK